MICKACGHPNSSTSVRCAACGSEIDNEKFKMFQAQSQFNKGVGVSGGEAPAPSPAAADSSPSFGNNSFSGFSDSNSGSSSVSGFEDASGADDFFASVPVAKPSKAEASLSGRSAAIPKEKPKESFFTQVSDTEEPAFETEIASLRPDDRPKGPEDHSLYSPPTNPTIEAYIAKRAAGGKS